LGGSGFAVLSPVQGTDHEFLGHVSLCRLFRRIHLGRIDLVYAADNESKNDGKDASKDGKANSSDLRKKCAEGNKPAADAKNSSDDKANCTTK
jgi:hypothetical protein